MKTSAKESSNSHKEDESKETLDPMFTFGSPARNPPEPSGAIECNSPPRDSENQSAASKPQRMGIKQVVVNEMSTPSSVGIEKRIISQLSKKVVAALEKK